MYTPRYEITFHNAREGEGFSDVKWTASTDLSLLACIIRELDAKRDNEEVPNNYNFVSKGFTVVFK